MYDIQVHTQIFSILNLINEKRTIMKKKVSRSTKNVSKENTNSQPVEEYEKKIQGLLDVNKILARENQFLSAQFDILRKEHDALGHMMRSRIALSNVKELELKSALEGMRVVSMQKDQVLSNLQAKYDTLVELMRSYESHCEKENVSSKARALSENPNNPGKTKVDVHVSTRKKIIDSDKEICSDDGLVTEAYHPWLSPVMMRLSNLEKQSESFEVLELKECLTPPSILKNNNSSSGNDASDDAQDHNGVEDVQSATYECQTPLRHGPAARLDKDEDERRTRMSSKKGCVTFYLEIYKR